MFSWFKPRSPLELPEKVWVEYRMRWLADKFGLEQLRKAPFVLPQEIIPDGFAGTIDDMRSIYSRLCDRIDTSVASLPVEVVEDEQLPGAVGHYDPTSGSPVIRIRRSQLTDSYAVTATLAHEIAHHLLLGRNYLTGAEFDHEWITDLLPVYFGIGVFSANTTVLSWATHTANWESWSVSRQGYLPSRMFGYALALAAWFRYESNPPWAQYLRADAAIPFRSGLRFLERSGNTLFHRETYRDNSSRQSAMKIIEGLSDSRPEQRIDAIWTTIHSGIRDTRVSNAIGQCLSDRNEVVATEAAKAIGELGISNDTGKDELERLVWSGNRELRAAAVDAAGRLQLWSDDVAKSFRDMLAGNDDFLHFAAVSAVKHFGTTAHSLTDDVIRALQRAHIRHGGAEESNAVDALRAVSDDPRTALRHFYANGDAELYRLAREALHNAENQAR